MTDDVPIDLAAARASIVEFLEAQLIDSGADGYVLGVSGGLDSTLGAHLAVEAVGADRVTGLVMPGAPSSEDHMRDARQLCESLGITWREIDIQPIVEATMAETPETADRETVGNVRARVRMVLWYREANEHDLLVLGADNRSEHLLGYFTKYGDAGVDLRALGDVYKTEVYELARHVGVDENIVRKTPTAELWEGQTDEGELGATYETIDAILRRVVDRGDSVSEAEAATEYDETTVRRFADMWRRSAHKRETPPVATVPRGTR